LPSTSLPAKLLSLFPITLTMTTQPRKPLDSQKNTGGDMSMFFFVQSEFVKQFTSPEKHHVKGLNAESVAMVPFPPPSWITSPVYTALRAKEDNSDRCFFSLNFSMYDPSIDLSDWNMQWFFMYGRVHPYALSWEVQLHDQDPEIIEMIGDSAYYTIPALIVRDQGYQP
jgi:hypothetical protein